jgi:segregation and condensation protein B
MSNEDDSRVFPSEIEALLFAAPRAMSANEVARAVDMPVEEIERILPALAERTKDRAVRLAKGLDGWSYGLAADAPVPDAFHREVSRKRAPSEAELATLAVVAMQEPTTVPEIESVRGLALSRGVMEGLSNRGWIRPALRRTDAGRAVAYETTEAFLETFGLNSAADMPTPEEAMMLGLDV